MLDSLPNPILLVMADDALTVNRAAHELCQRFARRMPQRRCTSRLYGWLEQEIAQFRLDEKQPAAFERSLPARGGELWFQVQLARLDDREPSGAGIIVTLTEITERKHAEDELRHSQERFRILFEHAPDAYYLSDIKGVFVDGNREAERITGYAREELIGANMLQVGLLPIAQLPRAAKLLAKSARGEPTGPDELVLRRKDGSAIEVEIRTVPFRIGKDALLLGIVRDISERKKAERARREAERRYRDFFENMPIGLYRTNPDGESLGVNDALVKMLGYPDRQTLLATDTEGVYVQRQDRQRWVELMEGDEVVPSYESQWRRYDGSIIWVNESARAVRDESGIIRYYEGAARDVTARKEAQQALRESESRYRLLAETSSDVIWSMDMNLQSFYTSPSVLKLRGYTSDEAMAQSLEEALTPESYQLVAQALQEELASGLFDRSQPFQSRAFELEVLRKDGSTVWTEVTVSVLRDEEGQPIGVTGVTRDISERRCMREALRKARDKAELYLDVAGVIIVALDSEGRITLINRRGCEILGYAEEELLGQPLFDLVLPDREREQVPSLFGEAVLGKQPPPDSLEGSVITRAGEERIILWHHTMLRDESGNIIGSLSSGEDITERKRAEEQLQQYTELLERANEEIKDFAYIVSHDLRAPLVNLRGFAAELREAVGIVRLAMEKLLPHLDDAQQRKRVLLALQEDMPEAIGFIDNAATRMDRFVRAVLLLSRLGRRPLVFEQVDMEIVVREALSSLQHQISTHPATVDIGPLPSVVADRTSMEMIVQNLLSNAVKYLVPERAGQIAIGGQRRQGETLFQVRDNGLGIAPANWDKVFRPFRRAGRHDVPGEGVGLAYTETLVRRHGGRIWFESEEGRGTTFFFTIADDPGEAS